MTENESLIHEGPCWPKGKESAVLGFMTLKPDPDGTTIFDCTELEKSDNTCKLLGKPCPLRRSFVPEFQEIPGVLHCEAAAGTITLDTNTGEATSPYATAILTATERKILAALMQNPGTVCTFASLYRSVYPTTQEVKNVAGTIRVHMKSIREKLGETHKKRSEDKQPLIGTRKSTYGTKDGGYFIIVKKPPINKPS